MMSFNLSGKIMQNDQFLKFTTKNKKSGATCDIIINKDRILYIRQYPDESNLFNVCFSQDDKGKSCIDVVGISLERLRDSLN